MSVPMSVSKITGAGFCGADQVPADAASANDTPKTRNQLVDRIEKPYDVEKHRRGETDGIRAIQHATVPLDHHTPVLGAEAALHGRQRQPAQKTHHDDHA